MPKTAALRAAVFQISAKNLKGGVQTPPPARRGLRFVLLGAFVCRFPRLSTTIRSGVRQGAESASPSGARSAEYPSGARVKFNVCMYAHIAAYYRFLSPTSTGYGLPPTADISVTGDLNTSSARSLPGPRPPPPTSRTDSCAPTISSPALYRLAYGTGFLEL